MPIYVGNLSPEVVENDLKQLCSKYGSVKNVDLPKDAGKHKGFGMVEMQSDAEEDAAIEALDGTEWKGKRLKGNKVMQRGTAPRDTAPLASGAVREGRTSNMGAYNQ